MVFDPQSARSAVYVVSRLDCCLLKLGVPLTKGRVEKPADYHYLRRGRARLLPSRRVEHAVAARWSAAVDRPPEGSDSRGFFNTPLGQWPLR